MADLLGAHIAQQTGEAHQWTTRIQEAERICRAHEATDLDPLPHLTTLRLALAGPLVGARALADGVRVPGWGERYVRRLRAAARRWVRFRSPHDTPSPAVVLLELAERGGRDPERGGRDPGRGGRDPGRLVRDFTARSKALRRVAIVRGPIADIRTEARARDAQRRWTDVLAAWPAWLLRAGDRPIEHGHDWRFLQTTHIPDRTVLDHPNTRRWLRAAAALWWTETPAVLTITDPHGHFALIPLNHAKAALDGDRTRDAWISDRPRRRPGSA